MEDDLDEYEDDFDDVGPRLLRGIYDLADKYGHECIPEICGQLLGLVLIPCIRQMADEGHDAVSIRTRLTAFSANYATRVCNTVIPLILEERIKEG